MNLERIAKRFLHQLNSTIIKMYMVADCTKPLCAANAASTLNQETNMTLPKGYRIVKDGKLYRLEHRTHCFIGAFRTKYRATKAAIETTAFWGF